MASSVFLDGQVRVSVPATSANLGPGFDSFGLALGLRDEVEVCLEGTGLLVEVTGQGSGEVPTDATHLVVRAMDRAFDAMGLTRPGLVLRASNVVPHGRGLGSSAAAVVAGVLGARALVRDGVDRLPDPAVLTLAASMEGHPDNVAACLLGGFTLAWTDAVEVATGSDQVRAVSLEVRREVVPVLCVPQEALATEKARGLLPATVSHRRAARNSARAALLVLALTARPELLLPATEDELHQEYRRPAMPASLRLVDELRCAGVAAVVSGAGPSVLALSREEQVSEVRAVAGDGWVVMTPGIDRAGAQVRHA